MSEFFVPVLPFDPKQAISKFGLEAGKVYKIREKDGNKEFYAQLNIKTLSVDKAVTLVKEDGGTINLTSEQALSRYEITSVSEDTQKHVLTKIQNIMNSANSWYG